MGLPPSRQAGVVVELCVVGCKGPPTGRARLGLFCWFDGHKLKKKKKKKSKKRVGMGEESRSCGWCGCAKWRYTALCVVVHGYTKFGTMVQVIRQLSTSHLKRKVKKQKRERERRKEKGEKKNKEETRPQLPRPAEEQSAMSSVTFKKKKKRGNLRKREKVTLEQLENADEDVQ